MPRMDVATAMLVALDDRIAGACVTLLDDAGFRVIRVKHVAPALERMPVVMPHLVIVPTNLRKDEDEGLVGSLRGDRRRGPPPRAGRRSRARSRRSSRALRTARSKSLADGLICGEPPRPAACGGGTPRSSHACIMQSILRAAPRP